MSRIKNNLTGDVFEAPARDFANEADFTIVDDSTPITAEPPVAVSAAGEPDTSASVPVEPASSGTTGIPDAIPSSDLTSTQTAADPATSSAPASPPTTTQAGTAPSGQGDDPNVSSTVTDSGTTTVPTPVDTSATDTTAATADASTSPSTVSTSTAGTEPAAPAASASGEPVGTPSDSSPSAATSQPASGTGDLGNVSGAASPTSVDLSADAAASNVPPTLSPVPSAKPALDVNSKHVVADQLESDALFAIAQLVTPTDSIKHAADAFFGLVHSQIDVEAAK
jgi:hypothetical protein